MAFHQANRSLSGKAETFANYRRVNVLFNEVLASLEQFTGENDRRGRSVKAVLFLSFGHFDDHLCSWVFDVHFLEDGGAVVGDDDIAH